MIESYLGPMSPAYTPPDDLRKAHGWRKKQPRGCEKKKVWKKNFWKKVQAKLRDHCELQSTCLYKYDATIPFNFHSRVIAKNQIIVHTCVRPFRDFKFFCRSFHVPYYIGHAGSFAAIGINQFLIVMVFLEKADEKNRLKNTASVVISCSAQRQQQFYRSGQ